MSEARIVQKKPFLKKGTRQFLSNAQVRSQSEKSKIHHFQPQEETSSYQPIQVKSQNKVTNNDEEIKIKAKPINTKIPTVPKRQPSVDKKDRYELINENTVTKPKRQISIVKKKQAVLSDYIENESALTEHPQKKSKPREQQYGHPKYRKQDEKKRQEIDRNLGLTKASNLVQQYQDQQQTANFMDGSFKQTSLPSSKLREQSKQSKEKSSTVIQKKIKQNKIQKLQQADNNQINFISDNEDYEDNSPGYRKKQNIDHNEQYRKQNMTENQPPRSSKIKMAYFNKDPEKNRTQFPQPQQPRQKQPKKQLTINDISKQLKQMIINQTMATKQQQIFQTLLKIKEKQQSLKKEKDKLDQQQKSLQKSRQQFEKQMHDRYQQWQEKIKNQNMKLMRQKKYMKETQMSNKGDWKIKSQLEQTKKQIEQLKDEKKKIQSKLKSQVENLRKKNQQQINKNKLLTQQVKILQYGQIIQKQQMKQLTKQQKKNTIQIQKNILWNDAPQLTYLNKIIQDNFSLIGINMTDYHYQLNQYYQYYLKIKDQNSILQSQTQDHDRAKRVYKNGKIQYEYFQKFLKQIFPFNYTIVHLWNGDVKQILPSGIQIYFSKNSGVTQITIKQNGFTKEICFFPNNDTAQMTAVYDNQPSKNITQVYCNGHLKRMLSDGSVVLEKRDSKGAIISIPMNS